MSASHRHKNSFVAEIAALIAASGLSQTEIARQLGYPNPNIITMFKKGTTRVPLDKVARLALVLGQNPGALLRHWFRVHEPEALLDLERYFGVPDSV